MKRLLAILFLVLFVYNNVAYYFIFKVEQWQIRETVEEQIKKNPSPNFIEIIEVPNENPTIAITWLNEKEISFGGSMYDVIKVKKGIHSTVYSVFNDKKEKELMLALDLDSKKNSETGLPSSHASLSKKVLSCFLAEFDELNTALRERQCPAFIIGNTKLTMGHILLSSPPPQA